MVYTGPSGSETTYYVTPMFEVVHTSSNTDYRHYIFAGGRVVMQLSRSLFPAAQRLLSVRALHLTVNYVKRAHGAVPRRARNSPT
jgi:hypothetical protein